jgi:dTDP-4-dehydrorhamnose reductase
MSILLTGAEGQLGWEINRRAQTSGYTVHALNLTALDITDGDAVERAITALTPKIIINAAAYTAVDKAETETSVAFAVNRDGPAHLAKFGALKNAPLIHVSTDYVFDGTKTGAYEEEDPVSPLGVYGTSKLAGEKAVQDASPNHVILRTSWVYGVHGHNFVQTMLKLGSERDTLRVVNDQYGCPTFAGDLADAILKITDRLEASDIPNQGFGTFHCAGDGRTTWFDFARKIFELSDGTLGNVPQVEGIPADEYPTPARRPANSGLNCGKLRRIYGITLRPWQDALADMLQLTLAEAAKDDVR